MSNREEIILSLISGGESDTVEFKESFDEDSLETVAALANSGGGFVLIGVADNGEVKGLSVGKETLRDWANRITQATRLNPKIETHLMDGKRIVLLDVVESSVKPISCRGRYFKRVGKSNRQLTEDDLTRIVLQKVGVTWDEVIEPRAEFQDLDPEMIQKFRALCNKKGRRLIPEEEDHFKVMEKLGLLQNGKPTRASLLLVGRVGHFPQRFYNQRTFGDAGFKREANAKRVLH